MSPKAFLSASLGLFIFATAGSALADDSVTCNRVSAQPVGPQVVDSLLAAPSKLATTPPGEYDKLFPRYAEVCSVRQVKRLTGDSGGIAGHALMFLKGVCRDKTAGYPKLMMCPEGTDLSDPESGTVVSVDQNFRNVNWVAVDGRSKLLDGGVKSLDKDTYKSVVKSVYDSGAFKGIKYTAKFLAKKPAGMSEEQFGAEDGAGTDYAVNFGRTSYCSKLPMNKKQLEAMVKYLNGLNERYVTGKEDYKWSGFNDNCTHVVHNALAAAGIRDFVKTGSRWYKVPFNMQLPENESYRIAKGVDEDRIDDLLSVYGDRKKREAFETFGQMPGTPGGVLERRTRIDDNAIFASSDKKLMWDVPLVKYRSKKLESMFQDKRFTDLRANLEYNHDRFSDAIAKIDTDPRVAQRYSSDPAFKKFAESYRAWLIESLQDADEKLKKLDSDTAALPVSN